MNEMKLAAYLDRRLAGTERDRVEAHLADCDACRDDVAETARVLARRQSGRRLWSGAAVLAAAASLTLMVRTATPTRGDTPVLRGGSGPAAVVAYGPLGDVRASAIRFVWAPVPGAMSYRLTVTTQGGSTLWTRSTGDTLLAPSDSVHFTRGERYLWFTDALLADGGVRSTGPHEFQLEP